MADQHSAQTERRLRAIVAAYYDVYGCLINVGGPEGRELVAECYREALSGHVDKFINEALSS